MKRVWRWLLGGLVALFLVVVLALYNETVSRVGRGFFKRADQRERSSQFWNERNLTKERQTPSISGLNPEVVLCNSVIGGFLPGTLADAGLDIPGLPFRLEVDRDGSVLLKGELRDAKDVIVADLEGRTVSLRAPGYDINSSERAFEVVDADGHPILQVSTEEPVDQSMRVVPDGRRFRPGNRVIIHYVAYRDGRPWVCSEEGLFGGGSPEQHRLKPIFRYPGGDFPGQPARK